MNDAFDNARADQAILAKLTGRYVIYQADRAGNVYDIAAYDVPLEALARLNIEQLKNPQLCSGIYDRNDPERGDVQLALEEMIS